MNNKSYCHRLLFVIIFIFSSLSAQTHQTSAQTENKKLNILFISSFSKNLPAQTVFESGLDKALGFNRGGHNLFFEFMEAPRLKEENFRGIFVRYLKTKYQGTEFDFMVGWAPRAIRFLKMNAGLFADVHRVYVEDSATDQAEKQSARETTIGVKQDYTASFQEVIKIESPRRIYVIGTTADVNAQARLKRFKAYLTGKASEIEVEYLLDQTLEQVALKLEGAPRDGAVAFYLLMFSDGKGTYMTPYAVVHRLASRSAVPIYSYWESMIGSGGIVGGYVVSHEKIGLHLGQAILSISNGAAVGTFSPMRHVYDWNALKKWEIAEDKLPDNAVILNRPQDIFIQYRWHILGAGTTILLLSVLSLFLCRTLKLRNTAIDELEKWWHIFKNAEWGVALGMANKKTIELLNPAYAKMHGYTADELTGEALTTVFPPDYYAKIPEIIKECHDRGHHTFEADHIRKDGTRFPAYHDVTTVKDGRGAPLYRIINVQDITDRRRNEEELRKYRDHLEELVNARTVEIQKAHQALADSEERFRSLSEAAFEGLVITEKGRILEANDVVCKTLGYQLSELLGMAATDLVPPEIRDDVGNKILSGYELPYESRCLRKDGSVFPVEIHARMFSYKGRQVRVTAVRDITERKHAEEQLRKYAESQEVLLREVNHRVKNNLAAIIGMLYKEQGRAEKKKIRGDTTVLEDLICRIEGLSTVHTLLSETGWQPLLIRDLCEQILHSVSQSVPLSKTASSSISPSPVRVKSNQAHHLALVINELATNSVKHALAVSDTVRISIEISQKKEMIRIVHKDDGPGFPEEMVAGDFSRANVGFDLIFGIVRESLRGDVLLANNSGAVTTLLFRAEGADSS